MKLINLRLILFITLVSIVNQSFSRKVSVNPSDSLLSVFLDGVNVFSTTKEQILLKDMPLSVTDISNDELQSSKITSIKSIGCLVPNFFMPEYGSRLTSSIYIRGIGSRINSPSVGLYVDDIPYYEKSAFDFHFFDVERIDVLRGPQGTLYGRNTMGGLVRITTRNPFNHPGTEFGLEYATGDNHKTIYANHYNKVNETFAFSLGGYYEDADGFFKNSYTNKDSESMKSAGGRFRGIWFASDNLKLDLSVGLDKNSESAYPYFYDGSLSSSEQYPSLIGKISNNRDNSYDRTMMNAGLSIEYQSEKLVISSVTSFQKLNDEMIMDQDFLSADIYTLEQKQKSNTISEEITIKNKSNSSWKWVSGINLFHQSLNTQAPVSFKKEGITMLEQMIKSSIPDLSFIGIKDMAVNINNASLDMNGTFETPVTGLSLFHQSDIHVTDHLIATIGLRADYEKTGLDYYSFGDVDCTVSYDRNGVLNSSNSMVSPKVQGVHDIEAFRLMPKLALKYAFEDVNVYATVSRGYRSGGYNVQMFSDILQSKLKNSMMLAFMPGGGASGGSSSSDNSGELVSYKPEYSINYEVGTHLNIFDGVILADASLFFINIEDQQISKFTEIGTGRQMVNAGRSRSYGAEMSLKVLPMSDLSLCANYGFTHATFTEYEDGNGNDYSDKYVPFVPANTLKLSGEYRLSLPRGLFNNVTFGVGYSGTGRVYWTENNNAYQNFYSTMESHILLKSKLFSINIWGKNLNDSNHRVFYFESMGRGYYQKCKPIQFGVDLKFSI